MSPVSGHHPGDVVINGSVYVRNQCDCAVASR